MKREEAKNLIEYAKNDYEGDVKVDSKYLAELIDKAIAQAQQETIDRIKAEIEDTYPDEMFEALKATPIIVKSWLMNFLDNLELDKGETEK